MRYVLSALVLGLFVGCGSSQYQFDPYQVSSTCPLGDAGCSQVCPLTLDQQIYYFNKADHTTGYAQGTTYGGSVYCAGGQIYIQSQRGGSYDVLPAGTYDQGTRGLLCGFTIDASCAISNRSYPQ